MHGGRRRDGSSSSLLLPASELSVCRVGDGGGRQGGVEEGVEK